MAGNAQRALYNERPGRASGMLKFLPMAAILVCAPLLAHHSFAMFDAVNRITLEGTVTKFEWTNPHAYIELDVADPSGGVKHYTIECASPNVLTRVGWKFNELKTGDRVTLLVNPLKNGKNGGM